MQNIGISVLYDLHRFIKLFESLVLVLPACLYHSMHVFIFITFIKCSSFLMKHHVFSYILLCFSRARSVNSLVSIDTASSVTPETSCQGTVARVTKPSAMESKITGIPLVSWELVPYLILKCVFILHCI